MPEKFQLPHRKKTAVSQFKHKRTHSVEHSQQSETCKLRRNYADNTDQDTAKLRIQ